MRRRWESDGEVVLNNVVVTECASAVTGSSGRFYRQ